MISALCLNNKVELTHSMNLAIMLYLQSMLHPCLYPLPWQSMPYHCVCKCWIEAVCEWLMNLAVFPDSPAFLTFSLFLILSKICFHGWNNDQIFFSICLLTVHLPCLLCYIPLSAIIRMSLIITLPLFFYLFLLITDLSSAHLTSSTFIT